MASRSALDAQPQEVLRPLSRSALFLVVTIDPGGEGRVRELLAGLPDLEKSVVSGRRRSS